MGGFFTKKRIVIISICVVLVAAIAIGGVYCINKILIPNKKYNNALKLLDNGEYAKAADILNELGDYKDCKELLKNFTFLPESEVCEYPDETKRDIKYEYDKNGNLLSVTDNYNGRTVFSEYENGLKVRDTETNDETKLSNITLYEYDDNGNLITGSTEFSSGDHGSVTYEYNDKCLKVKKSELYNNKVIFDFYYSYDKNNNLISESYGSMVVEYEYDDKNNLIRVISSDRTYLNGTDDIDEYIYDDNGNLVKEILLNGADVNEYEYDSDGRVTLKINYQRADKNSPYYKNSRTTYKYDGYGNLIKEVCSPIGDWDFDYSVREISYIVFYNK
ncbi:MAG: hypothetical protein IJE02_06570 [Clostridia bacterium]|nr:hypothetical protein [Clostridia bacterium]